MILNEQFQPCLHRHEAKDVTWYHINDETMVVRKCTLTFTSLTSLAYWNDPI